MYTSVIEEVLHIMIEQTSLGNIECWLLWDVDDKIIFILAGVGHQMIILDQAKGQDVGYSLGFIPGRIGIFGEVTNFVGVCRSCI